MFAMTKVVKSGFNSLSKMNIRQFNKIVTMNMVQFDEKFKDTVSTFLKQQNIKNFSMTFEYCKDNNEYTGNILTEYFTNNEQTRNDNELDYYIRMSNEFARKN